MLIMKWSKSAPDGGRPICIYPNGYGNTIAYYMEWLFGGYNGTQGWHASTKYGLDNTK